MMADGGAGNVRKFFAIAKRVVNYSCLIRFSLLILLILLRSSLTIYPHYTALSL